MREDNEDDVSIDSNCWDECEHGQRIENPGNTEKMMRMLVTSDRMVRRAAEQREA